MTIDFIMLVLFAILTFLGWRSGAISQALRIGAIVAVVIFSPLVSVIVRETLFRESSLATPMVEMGSLLVAGMLVYTTIVIAGWLVVRTMRAASKTLSTMDRLGGSAIGAVKGLLVVYVLAVVVVMIQVPLEVQDPSNAMHLRGGFVTTFVGQYNVLGPWKFPDLRKLHLALKVGALTARGGNEQMLREHARASDLLRKKAVRELLDDDALLEAAIANQYALTLADARVRALLNDDEFVTLLRSVDWHALAEVVEGELDDEAVGEGES